MTKMRPTIADAYCAGCNTGLPPGHGSAVGYFDLERGAFALRWFCRQGVMTKPECMQAFNEKTQATANAPAPETGDER